MESHMMQPHMTQTGAGIDNYGTNIQGAQMYHHGGNNQSRSAFTVSSRSTEIAGSQADISSTEAVQNSEVKSFTPYSNKQQGDSAQPTLTKKEKDVQEKTDGGAAAVSFQKKSSSPPTSTSQAPAPTSPESKSTPSQDSSTSNVSIALVSNDFSAMNGLMPGEKPLPTTVDSTESKIKPDFVDSAINNSDNVSKIQCDALNTHKKIQILNKKNELRPVHKTNSIKENPQLGHTTGKKPVLTNDSNSTVITQVPNPNDTTARAEKKHESHPDVNNVEVKDRSSKPIMSTQLGKPNTSAASSSGDTSVNTNENVSANPENPKLGKNSDQLKKIPVKESTAPSTVITENYEADSSDGDKKSGGLEFPKLKSSTDTSASSSGSNSNVAGDSIHNNVAVTKRSWASIASVNRGHEADNGARGNIAVANGTDNQMFVTGTAVNGTSSEIGEDVNMASGPLNTTTGHFVREKTYEGYDGEVVEDENDPIACRLGEFIENYSLDHHSLALTPRGLCNQSNFCYINATLQVTSRFQLKAL